MAIHSCNPPNNARPISRPLYRFGWGRPPKSNTFLVDGSPWNNPNLPPAPPFDLLKARDILKAAGYSWAADGRLVYPPPTDANFRKRVTEVTKPGYKWGGLKMLG